MRNTIGLAAATCVTVALWAAAPTWADVEADCREVGFNPAKAMQACTDIVGSDPKAGWAYKRRAEVHMTNGDYDRAVADLTKAIEIDPKDKEAYSRRAQARNFRRNLDRIREIDDLGKIVALDPKDAFAYVLRGSAHRDGRALDSAIADYGRAIEIDPAQGYEDYRARVFLDKGDHSNAIADFTVAIEKFQKLATAKIKPDPAFGSMADGMANMFQGFSDISARLGLYGAYSGRAAAYMASGDYERAIADYGQAIGLEPKLGYDKRALAYLKAGKAAQGLPDAERALELNPRSSLALDARGRILEVLGRKEEAIADFRKALEINSALYTSREALKRLDARP